MAAAAVAVICTGTYLSVRTAASGPSAGHVAARLQATGQPPPSARPQLRLGTLRTYRVATEHLTLTRSAPGLGRRVLRLTVRYPVVAGLATYRQHPAGLFPLVAFAPGYRHCAGVYRDLLRQWASAGYVVAAVDFPRTSCATASPDESDVTNQPADLAFVIRRLLARSAARQGRLADLIAAGKIAVAGHSDGGDTAAALAAAPCCRDRRVQAALILSGAQWPSFTGHWFARPAPPLLVIQGAADSWNPPADSVRLYLADRAGPRFYLDLPAAGHFTPYEGDGTPEPIVARVTVDFLDRYLLGQRSRSAAMWREGKVAGKAVLASAGHLPR